MANNIELTRTLVAKVEVPGLAAELALRGTGLGASVLLCGNANYACDLAARVAATKATDVNGRTSSLPTHMKVVVRISGYAVDPVTGQAASPDDLRASLGTRYGDTLATAVLHLDGLIPTVIVILEPLGGTFRGREAFDKSWRPRTQSADTDDPGMSRNQKPGTHRAANMIKPSLEWLPLLRACPTLVEAAPGQGADEPLNFDVENLGFASTFLVVAASPMIEVIQLYALVCAAVESPAEDRASVPSMNPGPDVSPSTVPLNMANETASFLACYALFYRVAARSHRLDLRHGVLQGTLKLQCDLGRYGELGAPLFWLRQEHRHALRVDRADYPIDLTGQEQEQPAHCLDAVGVLSLRTPHPGPRAPDVRNGEQRPIFIGGEPNRRPLELAVRVLVEGEERHVAAVFGFKPGSPIRALHVVHIRDGMFAESLRARDDPPPPFTDTKVGLRSIRPNRVLSKQAPSGCVANFVVLRRKRIGLA